MIEKLAFGRTGHLSTRTIFGAAALGKVTQAAADRTMELVLRHGINHIDTAASYGEAEDRLKPWMQTHRREFFLATKTDQRTEQDSYEQICRSLERMGVDQLDLIQLHALHTEDEWQTAFGPHGALKAVIRAHEEGLARFIGVTGHGVEVARFHLRSLKEFDFDSVLLPYNYVQMQNPQYAADFEELVSVAQARGIAIQTIKALLRRPWGDRPQTAATWYEPLIQQADVDRAVHWVLGRPGMFLMTTGDIDVLPMVFAAAERYQQRPTDAEMSALLREQQIEPLFT